VTWTLARLLSPRAILEVTLRRIDDLTDEEMLWEPVPGCMSVRDGVMDPLPREPRHYDGGGDPVTTIAWRLGHIVHDGTLAERNPGWLGVDDVPPSIPVASTADGLSNEAVHHGGEVGVLRDLWRAGLR
jgi:hypothetical protein